MSFHGSLAISAIPAPHLEDLKIYLINLDRSKERRARMTAKLRRLDLTAERVAAVDGQSLPWPLAEFDERGFRLRHGRKPNPYEIGCFLSHVDCARRLLATSASHALILEDDLHFDDAFPLVLQSALEQQAHWDILRLSTVNRGRKFPIRHLTPPYDLAIALTREKGSGAYVINRRAATWITEDLIPQRLPYDLAFDLEFRAGLRACFVHPTPVKQSDETISLIQNNLKAYRLDRRPATVLPFRALAETQRFLCRASRLVASRIGTLFGR